MPLINRPDWCNKIYRVEDYFDFLEIAQAGNHDAVIWDRWKKPLGKPSQQREAMIKSLRSHWDKFTKNSTGDIKRVSIQVIPEQRAISAKTTRLTPAVREYNSMASAYKNITGVDDVTISFILRSNSVMPTRRTRDCPILVSEWFSSTKGGYIIDPDTEDGGVKLYPGNWLYVTPEMPLDINQKPFNDKRVKRLTIIVEPSPGIPSPV